MTDECETCGGPMTAEMPPMDDDGNYPEWYDDGTCAGCAFEEAAREHYAKLGQPVSLEAYRASHGHLFFADPGNASPEEEAAIMAENERVRAEQDAQEAAPDA